jgi:hypothetical protein
MGFDVALHLDFAQPLLEFDVLPLAIGGSGEGQPPPLMEQAFAHPELARETRHRSPVVNLPNRFAFEFLVVFTQGFI